MRFRRVIYGLTAVACMLLFGGSAMAQGGELVRAEWGVPGNKVDVTARVRTFVHEGVLQLEVTRFNLGIDPAPHQNKELLIHVRRWDGQVEEYKYPERSTITLELDPEDRWEGREQRDRQEWRDQGPEHHDRDEGFEHHERGLRILRAYYGAEGQFVNVTDAVRSHLDDGRLFLHVDNYSMGVDPAPGTHKWLRVLYTLDGERRNATVDEKTDLRLP